MAKGIAETKGIKDSKNAKNTTGSKNTSNTDVAKGKKYADLINSYNLKYGTKELLEFVEGKKAVVKIKYPTLDERDKEVEKLKELLTALGKEGFANKFDVKGNMLTAEHTLQPGELKFNKPEESEELPVLEPEVKEKFYFGQAVLHAQNMLQQAGKAPIFKLFDSKDAAFEDVKKNLLDPLREYVESSSDYYDTLNQVLPNVLKCNTKDKLNRMYNSIMMNAQLRQKERYLQNVKSVTLNEITEMLKQKKYKTDEVIRILRFVSERIINEIMSADVDEETKITFLGKLSMDISEWADQGAEGLAKQLVSVSDKIKKKQFDI